MEVAVCDNVIRVMLLVATVPYPWRCLMPLCSRVDHFPCLRGVLVVAAAAVQDCGVASPGGGGRGWAAARARRIERHRAALFGRGPGSEGQHYRRGRDPRQD